MKPFVVALSMLLFLTGCWEYGVGEKVGIVIRLNKQGLFCKTWEAELIRGGMASGSGGFGIAPFRFTIEDHPELVERIKQAINSQEEVKISYRGEVITFCRSDSNNVFLTSITALNDVSK